MEIDSMASVNENLNENKFNSMQIEKNEIKINNHNGNDEIISKMKTILIFLLNVVKLLVNFPYFLF